MTFTNWAHAAHADIGFNKEMLMTDSTASLLLPLVASIVEIEKSVAPMFTSTTLNFIRDITMIAFRERAHEYIQQH